MCRMVIILVIVSLCVNTAAALPGSGTQQDPWRIESLSDFDEFADEADYWAGYTRLETDINLAGRIYFTATIAPDTINSNYDFDGTAFTGVFDGNDHKINLAIYRGADNDYLGLFGFLGKAGEVRNLGLEGGSVSGDRYIGGLVGENSGSVSNCYSTGEVNGDVDVGGLVGYNRGGVWNCYSTGDVKGDDCVGGLVGYNRDGSVSNCYSTGSVSGDDAVGGLAGVNVGVVLNCCSTGDVSGDDKVGGLVGSNYRSVLNCYSTGSVNGDDDVGGLVGYNSGSVLNCYSIGDVSGDEYVGGLVGENNYYGSVSNCYSASSVSGNDDVGGLVGRNNYYGSVSNCYSTGDVSGYDEVGGLVGLNSSSVSNCFWDTDTQTHGVTESIGLNEGTVTNVSGLPTTQMQTMSTFTEANWDFIDERGNGTTETWRMPDGGGYPVLSFFHIDIPVPLAGSGTAGEPYLVSDANEMGMVSWYPELCHFKLTRDIDLSGIHWSVAVVPTFTGCFDGDGYRVLNMQISGGGHLGLFGHLGASGQVQNLALEGCFVNGTGSFIGGLVGYNDCGSVSNCCSIGDVNGYEYVGGLVGVNNYYGSVSNCYSTGSVSGDDDVGGLVGRNGNQSIVSNCYSTGDVSGGTKVGGLVGYNHHYASISNCCSTGDVSGYSIVGGLVGRNLYGFVSNCYSTSDVNGDYQYVGGLVGVNERDSVSNCYSTGSVSADGRAGGLIGLNDNDGDVSNCYSTSDVSGNYDLGGLVGWNIGSISNCYSIGDVSGDWLVGGLVGLNFSSISNCFWDTDTQTHGVTISVRLNEGTITNVLGLTTDQMQTESTFTDAGWDFTTPVWTINEGVDYPRLSWEIVPVLHAEAEITVGTSNRISWEPIAGDVEYYAECAEDTNFTSIIYNSGWITETSYEFTGLQLGQRYWYRVKARNAAGVESQWSNVESSLQCTLAEAVEIMLDPNNLKSENLKKPYINKINTAQEMIDSGNFTSALNKLENDILQKTDGCAETGEPDKSDWIITCEEQSEVYSLIIETIDYVKSLMQ